MIPGLPIPNDLFISIRTLFYELLLFILDALLPVSISRQLLPQVDHFFLHERAHFEGFYTRILTEAGDSLIVIFCSKPTENPHNPNYLHFSWLRNGRSVVYSHDIFPKKIDLVTLPRDYFSAFRPFTLSIPDAGFFEVKQSTQMYVLGLPDGVKVEIGIGHRIPLHASDPLQTPEGKYARLAHLLPIHWHIFSTTSVATIVVRRPDEPVQVMHGIAHMEKNWGVAFPDGWTWSQAFADDASASIALAGGKIFGQKAYMVVFRTKHLQWDFAPPWTILLFGQGITITERLSKTTDTLELTLNDLDKKLDIRIQATQPRKEWIELYCPIRNGHEVFASETFSATMKVKAYVRKGLLCPSWTLVEDLEFSNVAFELGGDYR